MQWIFTISASVLFLAAAAAHIAGCLKGSRKIRLVTKPMTLPLLLAAAAPHLILRLPDSRNVLLCAAAAMILGAAADALLSDFSRTKAAAAGAGFWLAGYLCWLKILAPSFRLFPLPPAQALLLPAVYAAISAVFYFSALGKQDTPVTAGFLLCAAAVLILHGAALLTLVGTGSLSSVLLFAGATLAVADCGVTAAEVCGGTAGRGALLSAAVRIPAQALLAAGAALMAV